MTRRRKIKERRRRIITLVVSLLVLAGTLVQTHFSLKGKRHSKFTEKTLTPLVRAAAERHGLPLPLVLALIWKESKFNTEARGSAGELGLMQIMDGAVTDWVRATHRKKPTPEKLLSPEVNLEIGCWYLAQAHKHWDGYASQDILELAEYNAGRSTVIIKEWAPKDPSKKISLDEITFPGTRDYIAKILKRSEHYRKRLENEKAPR